MRKSKPHREELDKYADDIKGAALKWGVSERTIRRWLQSYGSYRPRKGYGPGKLDKFEVVKIRDLIKTHTQTEIAGMFGVSQATVGRVVNNISHSTDMRLKGKADVKFFIKPT
jgi:transposase